MADLKLLVLLAVESQVRFEQKAASREISVGMKLQERSFGLKDDCYNSQNFFIVDFINSKSIKFLS